MEIFRKLLAKERDGCAIPVLLVVVFIPWWPVTAGERLLTPIVFLALCCYYKVPMASALCVFPSYVNLCGTGDNMCASWSDLLLCIGCTKAVHLDNSRLSFTHLYVALPLTGDKKTECGLCKAYVFYAVWVVYVSVVSSFCSWENLPGQSVDCSSLSVLFFMLSEWATWSCRMCLKLHQKSGSNVPAEAIWPICVIMVAIFGG